MPLLKKVFKQTLACLMICSLLTTNVWATVPIRGTQSLESVAQKANTTPVMFLNAPRTDDPSVDSNFATATTPGGLATMQPQATAAAASIPATAYTYDQIASTLTPIQGVFPSSLGFPSINDTGEVSFTAQLTTDNRPSVELLNYDTNTLKRNFYMGSPFTVSNYLQVDNSDRISYQAQTTGTPPEISYINRLETTTGGSTIASGSPDPLVTADFYEVFPYPSINNNGLVIANASTDGTNNLLVSRAAGTGAFNMGPAVAAPATFFPIIADNGSSVALYPVYGSSLVLSDQPFLNNSIMSSTAYPGTSSFYKFTALGNKPGISHDGMVIGYMGTNPVMGGTGLYIFAWDAAASIWQGELLVGMPASSNLNYRVAVNKVATNQYSIVFFALNGSSVLGLYSIILDITNLTNPSPLTILAQVGQPLPSFSSSLKLTNIQTYYPVNTKGQVAFWASTASSQLIVRASPQVPASGTMQQAPINNSSCKCDPVYTHSGQFEYGCTDMEIPGKGMDLSLKHQYRAQTGAVSQFGFGWSTSYNERLNIVSNNAVISDGTGRVDTYTLSGTTYLPPAGFYQTLIKNANLTWTLTYSDGTVKTYDTLGRLSSIKDRHGNTISMAYSAAKVNILKNGVVIGSDYQLISVTGTNGRVVDFFYNSSGLLSSMKDVTTGRVTSFAYNATTNDLLTITKPATTQFPSGVPENFTYDANHNILNVKDGKGQTFVTNVFNAQNKVTQQTDASGTSKIVYLSGRTLIQDNKGFITQQDFNTLGNPIRETIFTQSLRSTDPASYITFKTYNSDMELTSVTYPNGNGIEYTYDSANASRLAHGNLLSVRHKLQMSVADNNTNDLVTTYTHESKFNQIQAITDPLGHVTTYTYDYQLATTDPNYGTQGNLVKITQPTIGTTTTVTQFTYNTSGQPLQITDPNGHTTNMTYDATTGYLLSIAQDAKVTNAITSFTYDTFGNVNKITDPDVHTTTLVYNQLNWLLTKTNALGYITKYTYDANGNLVQEDAQSNTAGTTFQTTKYTYNAANQVLTITDPLLRVTTFTYDADQNLSSKKDPKLNVTTYTYDERNLLFKVTDANNAVTQYNYDGDGNLQTVIDAKSNKTSYAYNNFNELLSTTYADASVEKYTYDKDVNLTQRITPAAQTITYTYDALNRLTAVTYPASTALNIARTYDAGSRLLTANNGYSKITYTYDALNRVTQESELLGPSTYNVKSVYDKAGNRTQVTYPDAKVAVYAYNALNQVSGVTVNGVALDTYAYDTLNRLTNKTFKSTVNQTSTYVYDGGDELSSLTNALTVAGTVVSKHSYTYDTDRNRLSYINQEKTVSTTANYVYDKINQLTSVTGAQAHTYAYDTLGNRTTADGSAYVSNTLNQYTSVAGSALTYDKNGNLLTQPGESYTYDAENRQTGMTKGTTVAAYTYDSFNRRVSKTVAGVLTYFVYDGDNIIEERNASGVLNADYVYGSSIDEVLTMTRGANTYYYQYDGLGSVRNLTNASGTVVETYDYDVYGKPTVVSTVGNPVMFTGRWYDTESGNYYYRSREYSPTYGRFMQRDPIGYFDSMNLFLYVHNNPSNGLDAFGLKTYYISNIAYTTLPTNSVASHSFVAITQTDWSGHEIVVETFSWENQNGGAWIQNNPFNIEGAQNAIDSSIGAQEFGNDYVDAYVEQEFMKMRNDTGYDFISGNCKEHALQLISLALTDEMNYKIGNHGRIK